MGRIGNVPSWDNGLIEDGILRMGIEEDYEGKMVLVTGGAKPFFKKVLKTLPKKPYFLVKVFVEQKSLFTTLRESRNGRVPSRIIRTWC